MPDSIQQMVTHNGRVYRGYAPRYVDVLKTLHEIGGSVESKSGLASSELAARCHLRHTREMSRGGFNEILKQLEQGGWIESQRGLRRTYRIALLNPLPPDIDDWWETPGQWEASTGVEHDSASTAPVPPADTKPSADEEPSAPLSLVPDWPAAAPPLSHDVEREELGGRPGRLAARIERQLPELVSAAVNEALDARRDAELAALGYYRGVSPQDYATLEAENNRLHSQLALAVSDVDELRVEVERLGSMVDFFQEEESRRLVHSNDGQAASKQSLAVYQLPEPLRPLGRAVLEAGWTIRRTRGGHLIWQSADRQCTTFSSSTPSTNTEPLIMARYLRRHGLEV